MTPLLHAHDVCFCIGSKTLLDGVTLSVTNGDTVALVGPNGAGKSTLMRVLSGEISESAGTVRLKGNAPRSYGPRVLAQHRAVLSQSIHVTFPFSVREIVRMGGGERRGSVVDTMVDEALDEVGLNTFHDRIIGSLSGGEQQRVHFARVLVQLANCEATHGPGVLLLDEPTASLDLRHQLDIVSAVQRRAARGMAVIVILHDLNLATLMARRIVVLNRGRIAGDGAPAQTITDQILQTVFGISNAVSHIPPFPIPFVLPQGATRSE